MTRPKTRARAPGVAAPPRPSVLLGGETRRERVAALLAQEGFAADSLAAPPDTPSPAPAAIMVCLERPPTPPALLVDPLRARFPGTPLILACGRVQRREVRAALAAGVRGVLIAEDLTNGLGPCLRAVIAGQVCVPSEYGGEVEPRALSAREREVLGLVAEGYMNSQIAERLFLAQSTVKSHLSSAFAKLGVRSRNEATELLARRTR